MLRSTRRAVELAVGVVEAADPERVAAIVEVGVDVAAIGFDHGGGVGSAGLGAGCRKRKGGGGGEKDRFQGKTPVRVLAGSANWRVARRGPFPAMRYSVPRESLSPPTAWRQRHALTRPGTITRLRPFSGFASISTRVLHLHV